LISTAKNAEFAKGLLFLHCLAALAHLTVQLVRSSIFVGHELAAASQRLLLDDSVLFEQAPLAAISQPAENCAARNPVLPFAIISQPCYLPLLA
jgi:hypothetical protein